jgi:DNA-binding transcriptional LysR family regulator
MTNQSRHILVFCKIIERGGISKAADDIGVSKSVVSQHLKSLETALGVTLLNRTTRRQTLTPVGKEFFDQCTQINKLTQQAWQQAQAAQSVAKGIVTITGPHALMEAIIAPAIGQLLLKYPLIKPVLLADDQRQDLIKNDIDIAVRVGELPDSDYKQLKLGEFRDVLCASKDYVNQHFTDTELPDPVWEQDWSAINYIANTWQGTHIKHQLTHLTNTTSVLLSFHPQRRANSLPTVVSLTKAGVGIALLPSFIVEKENDLQSINKNYQLSMNEVFALHAYSGAKPKAVELCIAAIKAQMNTLK